MVDDSAEGVGEAAEGVGDSADGVGVSTSEDSVVMPTENVVENAVEVEKAVDSEMTGGVLPPPTLVGVGLVSLAGELGVTVCPTAVEVVLCPPYEVVLV